MPSVSDDANTLKILLATDIHLGYAEKHPVKKDDSFRAFDEILRIANERKVDMVLLGGDLFHDNKPSRDAEMRCVEILRQHVLGDSPVSIDVVSDPAVNFGHCARKDVNYRDPNINVGMPVFSIHGNHDDPSGLGSHSCLDTLHATGLINYFGRITNLESVDVCPLLITKGSARLALYGMSSVKDERLHRLFRSQKVNFFRDEEDPESWFNLLVLHQNRAKHGPTSYIPEYFIDGMFDLVFWGHEHECRLEPEQVKIEDKEFHITQPGSSVATSLTEGEAKEKQVGLLMIREKEFKIEPIKLETVRPMVFKTIDIDEQGLKLRGTEKQQQLEVERFLKDYVEELLATEVDNLLTGHPDQPTQPQIRVRVIYTSEAHTLLPGKFGNYFEGRVANNSEILLFKKAPKERKAKTEENSGLAAAAAEANERVGSSMEQLLAEYFGASDDKEQLKLLSVAGLATAVKYFIEKDDKEAIATIVDKQMKKTVDNVKRRCEEDDEDDDIDTAVEEYRRERREKVSDKDEEKETRETLLGGSRANGDNNVVGAGPRYVANADDMDVDDEPTSGRGGRGRGRGRGSRASNSTSGRGRGARAKAPVVVASPAPAASSAASQRPTRSPQKQSSIQSAFAKQAERSPKKTPSSTASSRSSRTSSSSRKNRAVVYESDDDSD